MPTIEFRMDTTAIPHTYIVINNGAGIQQMYGFAPAVSGNLWGKGQIYDESISGPNGGPHPYDHTTGLINITADFKIARYSKYSYKWNVFQARSEG